MLGNMLQERVLLIKKTITQGALGQTITYIPVQHKYASVIPLDAQSRLQYQQLNSVVTHKIIFRGDVTIAVGNYRIKHGAKTYEPVVPPQLLDGNTVVMVKEI